MKTSESKFKRWFYRLACLLVGLLVIVCVLLLATEIVTYTAPKRMMGQAEEFRRQGRFSESRKALFQALDEAPNLGYRNTMLESMSRKFTSRQYYTFWKDLYTSASRNNEGWPLYYVYMQEDFAFRAMFACDSREAREFGAEKLKEQTTPELVRRTIEFKLKKTKDER